MLQTPFATIEKHFSTVEDTRLQYLVEHNLLEMVILSICAVICGADSWVEVADWARARIDWLKQYLELENGIPSHDTFSRVFLRIDPEQYQASFMSWIQAVFTATKGQVVAVDGKQLRGSKSKRLGRKAICMVSAWAVKNRIVLGQRKTEEKSNEIKAIPELLNLLEISGCIVTIDAAGCQKENARIIVDQGGNYLLAVKQNQGKLLDDIRFLFRCAHDSDFKGIDSDFTRSVSKGHGRIEIRECWAIDDEQELGFIRDRQAWSKLTTIVMIRSVRRVGEAESTKERYYISSLNCDAQRILEVKRSHWAIENGLHWLLDVVFDEDRHQLKGNGAANMAVVRHMALNLLKQEETAKSGIKRKRLKAAWSTAYLERVLQLG